MSGRILLLLAVTIPIGCGRGSRPDQLARIRHDRAPTSDEEAQAALAPPLAQMRGALRAIASAEELYYEGHHTYTTNVDTLRTMPACAFSRQVSVTILAATTRGWATKSTHPALPGYSCVQWLASPGEIEVPVTDRDHLRGDVLPGGVVCDSVR